MGKVMNMMQSNLLRRKNNLDINNKSNENVAGNNGSPITTTTKSENEHEEANMEANVNKALKRKVYELERYYIFEQNNTIDRYEAEKMEMQSAHAEEKVVMKKAFEHEKEELVKECERKDKILFELTKVMKEEYGKKIERQKNELMNMVNEKHRLLTCVVEKLQVIVDSVKGFIDNSITEELVVDLKRLVTEWESFLSSISPANLKKPYDIGGEMLKSFKPDVSAATIGNTEQFRLSQSEEEMNEKKFANDLFNERRNQSPKGKIISRTMSDCIGLKSECCRVHSIGDEDIQHELAQAYRKQKCELLKLFSCEKEEYEKAMNKEKDTFERDTREEYIQRMSVERKAWQETIEDLEREVAILKYERQQMDKNYCLGMDQIKTEFEREKNIIHRRYKESCLRWKKEVEEKMKNTRTAEEIDKNQDRIS